MNQRIVKEANVIEKLEYAELIANAKQANRLWEPFKYELHHITPKCLGGVDTKDNLVLLTIKEHYRAHILLSKMHPKNLRLANAVWCMQNAWQSDYLVVTEDEYEFYRIRAAKFISSVHKGRTKSETERENIRKSRMSAKPREFSDTAKANMSKARLKTWEERRANGTDRVIIAKTVATRKLNGNYRMSDEQKIKVGMAGKGRTPHNKGKIGVISDETRKKMRQSRLAHVAKMKLTKERTNNVL